MNEYVMDKNKSYTADGFIPEVEESIGYGTITEIDPETNSKGLVPIPTEILVGPDGQQREEDNPECYAKAIRFKGDDDFTYYVRMNARGDLADPWGIYSEGSNSNAKFARHSGRAEWHFKRVESNAFLAYLKYLVSRQSSQLRVCERSVKDG